MDQHIEDLKRMTPEERGKLKWDDPRLDTLAQRLEGMYGLPEGSLRALKYAENVGSKHDSSAVSPSGAKGMMQFIDSTRAKFPHNVNDPVESINAAGRLLQATLNNQYKGNIAAAFADYNGGPSQGKLVLAGNKPTAAETQKYLSNIKSFYTSYTKPK